MSQYLRVALIAPLSATIFRNCLAVALLLLAACSTRAPNGSSGNPASGVPPLGAHDLVDSGLQPGEYVTEKGWGHLQITREDENLFFSLDSVTGDGACALTGEFNGDQGIVMENSIASTCAVRFSNQGHGIEVSAVSQAECRKFCGHNGGFEGTYQKVQRGCSQEELEQAQKGFEQLYGAKDYKSALDKLSPALTDCLATLGWEEEGSIRNELAMAQYEIGLNEECMQTLSPYAEDANKDDDSVLEGWTPMLADRYLAIVKAARARIALCSEK